MYSQSRHDAFNKGDVDEVEVVPSTLEFTFLMPASMGANDV